MKKYLLLLATLMMIGCASSQQRRTMEVDLLIRNARVIDGTGAPWFRGDVAVIGDTIHAVGNLSGLKARDTIDADGHVVAPGFIDLLGHSERAVFTKPSLESKIRQGVTTEVTGEGNVPAPINDRIAAERASAPEPVTDDWRSYGDFMKAVEVNRSAVNFAFLVTTSNVRLMVLGRENRQPNPRELAQMKSIVEEAMRDGAIGLSTALIYVPAVFASTEEIIELAKVAAAYDGVYFSHIRNEGDRIDAALDETFRIGREAGIPVNIWHLKIGGRNNWGRMPQIVAQIEAARAQGVDAAANIYPYIASKTDLAVLSPDWALEGGYSAFLGRLKDPEVRARIEEELRRAVARRGDGADIVVTNIPTEELAQFRGKRLSDIAREMGVEPVAALLTIYEKSPSAPGAMYFTMNEDDVKVALAQPWVSVGADSSAFIGDPAIMAHPRTYGTFPRVIGHYVRDEKLFSLEEAVRKITSQAASRAKIWDRGVIRSGMKADLVVFDPENVKDLSTYWDAHHMSEGIHHVIVNGVPVLRDGQLTGALPGRVLRKGAGVSNRGK